MKPVFNCKTGFFNSALAMKVMKISTRQVFDILFKTYLIYFYVDI